MECAQLKITGGGSTSPATVSFPGAYAGQHYYTSFTSYFNINRFLGTDPGIKINIYQTLSSYTIPGKHCPLSNRPTILTYHISQDHRCSAVNLLSMWMIIMYRNANPCWEFFFKPSFSWWVATSQLGSTASQPGCSKVAAGNLNKIYRFNGAEVLKLEISM